MGTYSMRLSGADLHARGVGEGPLPGKSNYFLGNDPGRWRTNVPNYARIRYRNVYPGIDVLYYGSARDVEFDFILAPGADPRRIQLVMSGPELKLREPKVYQGERLIEARAVRKHNRVTFELAAYDHAHPLTIDPVIGFASLVGDAGVDNGVAIAVDRSGATYVTGNYFGLNGVTQNGAVPHAFVAKLSADGSTVLYNTYLAGTGQDTEFGYAVAVDASGNAFVTGKTFSTTFPVVNPAQRSPGGGGDAFVVKLGPDGSTLLYSTYLGGSGPDYASGIALDSTGSAYVTGTTVSDDCPTRGAFQARRGGHLDAFVTKYSSSGAMVYSTYFGGSTDDGGLAIAVDSAGSIYLTGYTFSLDFPVKDAIKPVNPGGGDAFIAKFTPDGSSLVWSTFLGGPGFEQGYGIAIDPNGNVYVAGTTSSRDFPTVSALQPAAGSAVLRKSVDGAVTFAPSDAGLPNTVSALAIDPENGSNVYAAVQQIGVYKSTDAGLTWTKVLDVAKNDFFTNLAIDPSAPSTVYAGSNGTINKSTDGGATWKSIKYGGGSVLTLAVNPKDSTVYAGSNGNNLAGLYLSTDGGETWRRPSLGGAQKAIKAFAIAASNPSILYVNCGNQLYTSTDGGGSFTLLTTPFFPNQIPGAILVDPSNSALLYAVGYPKTGTGGSERIFKSTDSGKSWSDTGFSPAGLSIGNQPAYVYISALAMDAGTATIYAATSVGLFKTIDGFDHTAMVNSSGNLYQLTVSASAPGTLYAATPSSRDGFVARLNADGKSYQYVTYLGGTGDDGVNSIAVDAAGNAYVAGFTSSGDFPAKNAFAHRSTINDGFVAKLSPDAATLSYSSFVCPPAPAPPPDPSAPPSL